MRSAVVCSRYRGGGAAAYHASREAGPQRPHAQAVAFPKGCWAGRDGLGHQLPCGTRAGSQCPALTACARSPPLQAIGNIIAQFAGAIMGSLLLWGTTSMRDGGLGANGVSPHFSNGNAILGEAVMTFL